MSEGSSAFKTPQDDSDNIIDTAGDKAKTAQKLHEARIAKEKALEHADTFDVKTEKIRLTDVKRDINNHYLGLKGKFKKFIKRLDSDNLTPPKKEDLMTELVDLRALIDNFIDYCNNLAKGIKQFKREIKSYRGKKVRTLNGLLAHITTLISERDDKPREEKTPVKPEESKESVESAESTDSSLKSPEGDVPEANLEIEKLDDEAGQLVIDLEKKDKIVKANQEKLSEATLLKWQTIWIKQFEVMKDLYGDEEREKNRSSEEKKNILTKLIKDLQSAHDFFDNEINSEINKVDKNPKIEELDREIDELLEAFQEKEKQIDYNKLSEEVQTKNSQAGISILALINEIYSEKDDLNRDDEKIIKLYQQLKIELITLHHRADEIIKNSKESIIEGEKDNKEKLIVSLEKEVSTLRSEVETKSHELGALNEGRIDDEKFNTNYLSQIALYDKAFNDFDELTEDSQKVDFLSQAKLDFTEILEHLNETINTEKQKQVPLNNENVEKIQQEQINKLEQVNSQLLAEIGSIGKKVKGLTELDPQLKYDLKMKVALAFFRHENLVERKGEIWKENDLTDLEKLIVAHKSLNKLLRKTLNYFDKNIASDFDLVKDSNEKETNESEPTGIEPPAESNLEKFKQTVKPVESTDSSFNKLLDAVDELFVGKDQDSINEVARMLNQANQYDKAIDEYLKSHPDFKKSAQGELKLLLLKFEKDSKGRRSFNQSFSHAQELLLNDNSTPEKLEKARDVLVSLKEIYQSDYDNLKKLYNEVEIESQKELEEQRAEKLKSAIDVAGQTVKNLTQAFDAMSEEGKLLYTRSQGNIIRPIEQRYHRLRILPTIQPDDIEEIDKAIRELESFPQLYEKLLKNIESYDLLKPKIEKEELDLDFKTAKDVLNNLSKMIDDLPLNLKNQLNEEKSVDMQSFITQIRAINQVARTDIKEIKEGQKAFRALKDQMLDSIKYIQNLYENADAHVIDMIDVELPEYKLGQQVSYFENYITPDFNQWKVEEVVEKGGETWIQITKEGKVINLRASELSAIEEDAKLVKQDLMEVSTLVSEKRDEYYSSSEHARGKLFESVKKELDDLLESLDSDQKTLYEKAVEDLMSKASQKNYDETDGEYFSKLFMYEAILRFEKINVKMERKKELESELTDKFQQGKEFLDKLEFFREQDDNTDIKFSKYLNKLSEYTSVFYADLDDFVNSRNILSLDESIFLLSCISQNLDDIIKEKNLNESRDRYLRLKQRISSSGSGISKYLKWFVGKRGNAFEWDQDSLDKAEEEYKESQAELVGENVSAYLDEMLVKLQAEIEINRQEKPWLVKKFEAITKNQTFAKWRKRKGRLGLGLAFINYAGWGLASAGVGSIVGVGMLGLSHTASWIYVSKVLASVGLPIAGFNFASKTMEGNYSEQGLLELKGDKKQEVDDLKEKRQELTGGFWRFGRKLKNWANFERGKEVFDLTNKINQKYFDHLHSGELSVPDLNSMMIQRGVYLAQEGIDPEEDVFLLEIMSAIQEKVKLIKLSHDETGTVEGEAYQHSFRETQETKIETIQSGLLNMLKENLGTPKEKKDVLTAFDALGIPEKMQTELLPLFLKQSREKGDLKLTDIIKNKKRLTSSDKKRSKEGKIDEINWIFDDKFIRRFRLQLIKDEDFVDVIKQELDEGFTSTNQALHEQLAQKKVEKETNEKVAQVILDKLDQNITAETETTLEYSKKSSERKSLGVGAGALLGGAFTGISNYIRPGIGHAEQINSDRLDMTRASTSIAGIGHTVELENDLTTDHRVSDHLGSSGQSRYSETDVDAIANATETLNSINIIDTPEAEQWEGFYHYCNRISTDPTNLPKDMTKDQFMEAVKTWRKGREMHALFGEDIKFIFDENNNITDVEGTHDFSHWKPTTPEEIRIATERGIYKPPVHRDPTFSPHSNLGSLDDPDIELGDGGAGPEVQHINAGKHPDVLRYEQTHSDAFSNILTDQKVYDSTVNDLAEKNFINQSAFENSSLSEEARRKLISRISEMRDLIVHLELLEGNSSKIDLIHELLSNLQESNAEMEQLLQDNSEILTHNGQEIFAKALAIPDRLQQEIATDKDSVEHWDFLPQEQQEDSLRKIAVIMDNDNKAQLEKDGNGNWHITNLSNLNQSESQILKTDLDRLIREEFFKPNIEEQLESLDLTVPQQAQLENKIVSIYNKFSVSSTTGMTGNFEIGQNLRDQAIADVRSFEHEYNIRIFGEEYGGAESEAVDWSDDDSSGESMLEPLEPLPRDDGPDSHVYTAEDEGMDFSSKYNEPEQNLHIRYIKSNQVALEKLRAAMAEYKSRFSDDPNFAKFRTVLNREATTLARLTEQRISDVADTQIAIPTPQEMRELSILDKGEQTAKQIINRAEEEANFTRRDRIFSAIPKLR